MYKACFFFGAGAAAASPQSSSETCTTASSSSHALESDCLVSSLDGNPQSVIHRGTKRLRSEDRGEPVVERASYVCVCVIEEISFTKRKYSKSIKQMQERGMEKKSLRRAQSHKDDAEEAVAFSSARPP